MQQGEVYNLIRLAHEQFPLNAVIDKRCTYEITKETHSFQQYANCYDCFPNKNDGACLHCIRTCHKGHKVSPTKSGNFFCDCATKPCHKVGVAMEFPQTALSSTKRERTFEEKLLLAIDQENTVYSPFSITYILNLLLLGASANTEMEITNCLDLRVSKTVIKNTLQFNHKTYNNSFVKLANAIIVNENKPVKSQYLDLMNQFALICCENFSDPSAITNKTNAFINNHTNGLVKDMVSPSMINSDTVMLIINTIYFKSDWKKPFAPEDTIKDRFITARGEKTVDMMTITGRYPYYSDSAVALLEMPYKGHFCMGFILPQLIVQPEFMADLASKNHDKSKVRVRIPKFTQRKNIDLIPVLKCLGINDLFTSKAKLDDMCEGIYVSNMLHEAVVIVDEKGTEASAATVAICVDGCMQSEEKPPITFNANHPFVYYIKYVPTKTILFIGCYDG